MTENQPMRERTAPKARPKCHHRCSWPCFRKNERNVTIKRTYPEARPSAALVHKEVINHVNSGVFRSVPRIGSCFNDASKQLIDVGPTTKPAAFTETIPVKTGK